MSARLWFGLIALPVVLGAGVLASHRLLPALVVPPRALVQPLVVVTEWGASGTEAWLLLASTLCLAGCAYALVLSELYRRDGGRLAALGVLVAAVVSLVVLLGFRFVFSSDLYAYAGYGALAAVGEDPYRVHAPLAVALADPAFAAGVRYEWPSLPACVYGPAFVWLARHVVVATHGSLPETLMVLRGSSVVAFVATLAAIVRFAPRGTLVAATVGCNPVALWSVAEGHNDALAFFMFALGIVLAPRRSLQGGIVAAASTLLKATGGLAALFAAYGFSERRFTAGAVATLAGVGAVQLAAIVLAGGMQLQSATDYVGSLGAELAIGVRGLLALVAAGLLLHAIVEGARVRAVAIGALVIWMLLSSPYAWYGLWLLPVAALTLNGAEGLALLAATFCGLLRYLSDANGATHTAPWLALAAVAIPVTVLVTARIPAWRTHLAEKTQTT